MDLFVTLQCKLNALKQFRCDAYCHRNSKKEFGQGSYIRVYVTSYFGVDPFTMVGKPYNERSESRTYRMFATSEISKYTKRQVVFHYKDAFVNGMCFKYNAKTLAFVNEIRSHLHAGEISLAVIYNLLHGFSEHDHHGYDRQARFEEIKLWEHKLEPGPKLSTLENLTVSVASPSKVGNTILAGAESFKQTPV